MPVISTKDRRYPTLMGMVAKGIMRRGRFMYDPDGTKIMEFIPNGRTRRNPVASFGKDERKYKRAFSHYGGGFWMTAWWREAIQNSVDAGATRIEMTVERHDGFMLISADDNGRGMDLETLQSKFLSEAGTSKGAGDSGGFGIAKELLLMPWMEWYVETKAYWAKGFREEPYEYDTMKTPREGTKIIVKMSDKDGEHTDIEYAIACVSKCYAPNVTFICNGKKVNANLGMGKAVDQKTFGNSNAKISLNTEATLHGLFVRDHNNLYMFERSISDEVPGAVICTITGDPKKLLSDSRMTFGDFDLNKAVDDFLKNTAVDINSAFKPPPEKVNISLHKGQGKIRAVIEDVHADLQVKIARKFQTKGAVSKSDIDDFMDTLKRIGDIKQTVRTTATEGMVKVILNLVQDKDAGESVATAAACLMGCQPDVIVYNECADEIELPEDVLPGPDMKVSLKKVLQIWTEFCRVIMIRMGSDRPFGIGWNISKDERKGQGYVAAKACRNIQLNDGSMAEGEWLLLNPYKNGRVPIKGVKPQYYSIRNDVDLNELFALALHECTHLLTVMYHSESYTMAFTDIVARNIPTSHLIRTIRDAVAKKSVGENDEGRNDDAVKADKTAEWTGKVMKYWQGCTDSRDTLISCRETADEAEASNTAAVEAIRSWAKNVDHYYTGGTLTRLMRSIIHYYSDRYPGDNAKIFAALVKFAPTSLWENLTESDVCRLFAYHAYLATS